MNIEITLKELNGKQIPAVTSLQVAEAFGKEHRHVLRDIRETIDKCSVYSLRPTLGSVNIPIPLAASCLSTSSPRMG